MSALLRFGSPANRAGNPTAQGRPARGARIRRSWRAALIGAVMLGVSVSPSWGQNYGADTDYFAPATADCLPTSGSVITDKSSGQSVGPPINGVIWGDGAGNTRGNTPGGYLNGTASFHLFDPIATQTCTDSIGSANSWFAQIASLMQYTFNVLAVLELCWAAALWAFEKEHMNSLAAEMIKKIMFIGFFYTLLHYGQAWIPAITNTFSNIGTQVTHIQASTDGIIAMGLAEVDFIWRNAQVHGAMTIGNWPTMLPKYALAALVTVGIVISAIVLAAQFFMAQVEGYIMLAVGAVFLGLGANSLTQEYVKKTLDYSIVVGVRLLTIILIDALIEDAIQTSISNGWSFDIPPLARMGAVSLMQLMMALRAPEMASALMSAGVGMTAGAAGAQAGSVTSLAAKAVNSAVGQVGSAVGGATNLVKAASAGTSIAQQGGKTGVSAVVAGLGKAVFEATKSAPAGIVHKLQNALSSDQRQPNSNHGPFAMARQKLTDKLAASLQGGGPDGAIGDVGRGPGENSARDGAAKGLQTDGVRGGADRSGRVADANSARAGGRGQNRSQATEAGGNLNSTANTGAAEGGTGSSTPSGGQSTPSEADAGIAAESRSLVVDAASSSSVSLLPPLYRRLSGSVPRAATETAAAKPANGSTALNSANRSSGDT